VVEVRWGKKVVGVKEDKDEIMVVFDGTSGNADLVLGGDGIDSVVITLYVVPEVVPQYSRLFVNFQFFDCAGHARHINSYDLYPCNVHSGWVVCYHAMH
jgi:2-polyprenyl-6-methoxyphenol hydroxylase-like FAD-dependent oxidoreductase